MVHPDNSSIAAMLRLPDEILLKITTKLQGASGDLHSLALTHRRFRFVVQEALMREGRVSMRGIPKYIELLWENQGLIPQIEDIELIKDRQGRSRTFTPSENAERACASFVQDLTLDIPSAERRTEVDKAMRAEEFWMMALLAILSHLISFTVTSSNGLRDMTYLTFLERSDKAFRTGLQRQVMRKGLGRLQVLNIVVVKGYRDPPFLGDYEALKVLVISGKCFFGDFPLPPWDLIPTSLRALVIPCGRNTFPWEFLAQLQEGFMGGDYTELRRIHLLVDEPFQSFAQYVHKVNPRSPDYDIHDDLATWTETEVEFQTLFKEVDSQDPELNLQHYKPGDLLKETHNLSVN